MSLPLAAVMPLPLADFDQEMAHLKSQLHQTQDAVEPAVQAERARRLMSWLARSAVKLNFFLGVALVVSLGLNAFLAWHATHPVREYFGSDNGRIFPLIPMSHPYRKPPDVIQYAADSIRKSFTMDFNNWRDDLERVRTLYTPGGFKSFLDQLKESGFLETVRTKRMNMSLVSGGGVLIKDGLENGTYVWFVEFPIEVKLAGQTSELAAQKFKAIVRVERVPTLDSIEGIAIGQFVTKPWSGSTQ
jgi:intracellular multiplication protein IcmL